MSVADGCTYLTDVLLDIRPCAPPSMVGSPCCGLPIINKMGVKPFKYWIGDMFQLGIQGCDECDGQSTGQALEDPMLP